MAGAGFKTFNTGDVLTASDVNTYLMQQTVMVFANSTARSTALGANVAEGMLSYLKDTKNTEYYNGTSWIVLSTGGDITGVTAGIGITGGGTSGTVTITNDMATAIDAKGDLIAGTGADTYARLAVGTNGQVLTADSTTATGLKWETAASGATFSGVSLSKSADQTISNNTTTAVTFDTEQFDTDGFHSTTSNTSRITIPSGKAGKYLLTASPSLQGNATGRREFGLYKNGTNIANTQPTGNVNSRQQYGVTVIADAAVGDYFELQVFQDSGGNLTLYSGTTQTIFQAVYLGA